MADGRGLHAGAGHAVRRPDAGRRRTTSATAARRPARRPGITYRQLDYWARTGLVVPTIRSATGSGSQRLYSFKDILVLKVVKRLLDTGVSLQNIRSAVEALRARGVDDLARITLLSDGATVYECTSSEEVVDLLRGGQGVFGIAVSGALRELRRLARASARRTRRRRRSTSRHVRTRRAVQRRQQRTAGRVALEPSRAPASCRVTRRPLNWLVPSTGWSNISRGRVRSRMPRRRRRGNLPGTSQAPGPRG